MPGNSLKQCPLQIDDPSMKLVSFFVCPNFHKHGLISCSRKSSDSVIQHRSANRIIKLNFLSSCIWEISSRVFCLCCIKSLTHFPIHVLLWHLILKQRLDADARVMPIFTADLKNWHIWSQVKHRQCALFSGLMFYAATWGGFYL